MAEGVDSGEARATAARSAGLMPLRGDGDDELRGVDGSASSPGETPMGLTSSSTLVIP